MRVVPFSPYAHRSSKSTPSSNSSPFATDALQHVTTDRNGLISTSTRTVIIEATQAPSIVPTDDASSSTAGHIARLSATLRLNWRTRHRAVGTKYAAISCLRPELRSAASALILNLAGIGPHRLRLCGSTTRACNDRLIDHGLFSRLPHPRPTSASHLHGISELCTSAARHRELYSLRLDVGRLDDLAPLLHLVGDECSKLRRGTYGDGQPEGRQMAHMRGIPQSLVHCRTE